MPTLTMFSLFMIKDLKGQLACQTKALVLG